MQSSHTNQSGLSVLVKAATAEDAQRIHAAIRAHIAEQSEEVAKNVVIQYGGSVKPENAAAYFAQPDIDGALVGGAALDAASFAAIAKAAVEAKNNLSIFR